MTSFKETAEYVIGATADGFVDLSGKLGGATCVLAGGVGIAAVAVPATVLCATVTAAGVALVNQTKELNEQLSIKNSIVDVASAIGNASVSSFNKSRPLLFSAGYSITSSIASATVQISSFVLNKTYDGVVYAAATSKQALDEISEFKGASLISDEIAKVTSNLSLLHN